MKEMQLSCIICENMSNLAEKVKSFNGLFSENYSFRIKMFPEKCKTIFAEPKLYKLLHNA